MKTKNKKNSNFYFILKQKSNVPFDPRIIKILSKFQFKKLEIEIWIFNFYFQNRLFITDLSFNIQNLIRELHIKLIWKLGWKSIFNQKMLLQIEWTKYTRTARIIGRFSVFIEKW